MDFIIDTDTSILLFFNSLHSAFFDTFFSVYSGRWVWIPLYAALLWAIWRTFSWRVALTITLSVVLVITLADQICATVIRPYVERIRPAQLTNPISPLVHIVNGYRGGQYGFPSCHAANSFALATFIAMLRIRRRIAVTIFIWAILNCYSRIYLGVHYPGDLLIGAIIGSGIAVLIYYAARAIVRLEPADMHPTLTIPHIKRKLTHFDLIIPVYITIVAAISLVSA